MVDEDELGVLKEIRAYTHIVAADVLRKRAEEIFDSLEKARVYENLDGTKSDYAISALIGVPRRTVTSWVSEFAKNGLAATGGRFETALFSLEELGLNVRTLKRKTRKIPPSPASATEPETPSGGVIETHESRDLGEPDHSE